MGQPSADAPKGEWRSWARSERQGVDMEAFAARVRSRLHAWGAITPSTRVLIFDPLADEPDLWSLDATLLLTRTPDEGDLTIHRADGPLERHPLGFRQPLADAPQVDPATVDVVLVPGLAFDRSGGRLGRGSAYYDRLLPSLRPGVPLVGTTPASCVVAALPMDPHDVRVTHLATEDGVRPVGSVPAMDETLAAATQAWIEGDPDPATRAELEALLAAGDELALRERMGASLEFGTAGIRGAVEAGSNRMNRAVVIRTTKGLADFLRAEDRSGPIVLGYDARPSSRQFAEDAVGVLTAAAFTVRYFDVPTPTPVVAFTALRLAAAAAVVVTASHNPPQDNGYKVYDDNGAQIVPPIDEGIAAAIARTGPAAEIQRVDGAMSGATGRAEPLGEEDVNAYLEAVADFRSTTEPPSALRIVYTPLHGVGGETTNTLLARSGYTDVHTVPEQGEPDGRFPTVAFPNPEEPGALDLAMALASDVGADLVLANDPDADRLAVVLPTNEGYRALTGNQIGVLMADFVLERWRGPATPLVVNSIVSSPMLRDVAAVHGARFEQTLTGFKWISNAAIDLERDEDVAFVFGFEEALGYTVGPAVRDKDGISAALWFADLTAHAMAEGESVFDRLERLYRRHGLWASLQKSIVLPGAEGLERIAVAMTALRSRRPERLGAHAVDEVIDYRDGAEERPRWLPATSLVEFDLGSVGRVLVRPSGTEPKLKIYVDRRVELDEGDDVWSSESAALDDAAAVADDLAAFLGLG